MIDLQNPAILAGVIGAGAFALRTAWALAKPKLNKLPPEIRPLVAVGASAAIGFLTALSTGNTLEQAVILSLGVFTGSEASLRVQKGREKRIEARDTLSLPDKK